MLLSIATNFIKKPVLTTVCTILILLIGGICIPLLPLDKLPELAPKQVSVGANYIGADAKTTADNVTTPLEKQINGTEQVEYMTSSTDSNGNASIGVFFPVEMDRNIAQVLVQNQVSQAQPNLPDVVVRTGVTTNTQSPSLTLAYAFYSDKDQNGNFYYDTIFISNYIDTFLFDEIRRIEGIGSLSIAGERKYAMRLWFDPDKLAARGLSAQDVIATISQQNIQVGAGSIGQQPAPDDQKFQITLRAIGRFSTPEEAENLVVKVGNDGTLIRIKDVGRAELGAENYSIATYWKGAPGVALLAYQLPGTNALATANAIKAKMAELQRNFPPGLKVGIALDSTLFVEASLSEVFKTLLEAIALVILVIFIFLQDWRTTIIPAIAIPVSLIGTMAFLLAFRFTLNQLTLFGVILATGMVVDDGIVIVEAISAKISQGMRPMQASLDAMNELTSAVIATSLVLMGVFIPVSFFPGTTGIVYKQFALTIAFSVAISTFNALSFSPSISAILLRRQAETQGPLGWLFRWFNQGFDWVKAGYTKIVEFLIQVRWLTMAVFAASLVTTAWVYQITPQGFIPEEDQGYFFVITIAPPGVSLNYTTDVTDQITQEILKYEEVEGLMALPGFGFSGSSSNTAITFVNLKNWEERPGAEHSVFAVTQRVNQWLRANMNQAQAIAANAPPVDGLSSFGGFEFQLQNRAGLPTDVLIQTAQKVMAAANQRPELQGVFTQFTFDAPIMSVSVNRNQAKAQNVDIQEIFNVLQTYLGSNYVNQFIYGNRLYRVFAQAESKFRSNPEDIGRFYVRSNDGNMIQLSNLVNIEQTTAPPILTHYNVYSSINIQGAPAPGYSTGQSLQAMEEVAAEVLPQGFGYEWTGTAREERSSGGAAPILFGLAFVIVFLILSAQYESYVDPIIIMITVPLAILGALAAILFRANILQADSVWPIVNNNIYGQVALVMLIGLASKNAILIVEFANQARSLGMGIVQAAVYAAEERLRPILMTAISGLVGFAPLLIASGAGAMSRWTLGTAIFGGYLISTLLGLFLVPVLYVVIKNIEDDFLKGNKSAKQSKSKNLPPKTPQLPQDSEEEEAIT